MKKNSIIALCVACLTVSSVRAQDTTIAIQASRGCVSSKDSAVLTVVVTPVSILPANVIITWKYKGPTGPEVTLPDKGMTIVVKDFLEAYRSYWFTFVDVTNVLRTGCKPYMLCKCVVLAANDLSIRLDQHRLQLGGTSFYEKVLLMQSADERQWSMLRDVTHDVRYDLSVTLSTYFRLDGYIGGQLIQSSPIVFLNKIQYDKPLSGEVQNFAGQKIASFTNVQAYNDANLGMVVTKDLPNQTYVVVVIKHNKRYARVYTKRIE